MHNEDGGDSFVRWQKISREQLTYAINLILGLSVAALGFELSLAADSGIGQAVTGGLVLLLSYTFAITTAISVILQGCSTGVGIWVVVNRLSDFRLTASIARRREGGATDGELKSDREQSKTFGARTWCLFNVQIFCFGAGILFAVLSVAVRAALKVLLD